MSPDYKLQIATRNKRDGIKNLAPSRTAGSPLETGSRQLQFVIARFRARDKLALR